MASRPSLWLGLLKLVLVAGAVYDLIFAAMMVLAPELATRLLELQPPNERYFLGLIAVFLVMLAAFYLVAAYDPSSYGFNVRIAIVGRLLGAVALYTASLGRPDLWGLVPLAAADLAFSLATLVCWWPIRKTFGI